MGTAAFLETHAIRTKCDIGVGNPSEVDNQSYRPMIHDTTELRASPISSEYTAFANPEIARLLQRSSYGRRAKAGFRTGRLSARRRAVSRGAVAWPEP